MPPHYWFPRAHETWVTRVPFCGKSLWQLQELDSYACLTTFNFGFTERLFMWNWEVCAFPKPSIFIVMFSQYGCLFVPYILVTICSLGGCCGSPSIFHDLQHYTWNCLPGQFAMIQSVQMKDATSFVLVGSLPVGLWNTEHQIPTMRVVIVLFKGPWGKAEQTKDLAFLILTVTIIWEFALR